MKRLVTLASITSLALIVGNQTAIAAPMQNNQLVTQAAACDSVSCTNKSIAKEHDSHDQAEIELQKEDLSKGAFITETERPMESSMMTNQEIHKENTQDKITTNNNISFTVKGGSLKDNIEKFGKKFNYTIIWKVTDIDSGLKADFNWIGNEDITGKNDLGILHNILGLYKLNTTVWNGNRVICISNTSSCK